MCSSVAYNTVRRRQFDTTIFFFFFVRRFIPRIENDYVAYAWFADEIVKNWYYIEESCRYSNIIIIRYDTLYIVCACIRKTRVRESSHWKVCESERRWIGIGVGAEGVDEAVGIANGVVVVVVVGGVNGNIFPFNESPGAYSVTGTGRDVIPGASGAVWDRGEGGSHFHRRGHRHHHYRRRRWSPARVYRLRSRARCTRRGGSVCFSSSFRRVRLLRSRVSRFVVRSHRFCRRTAISAAANPHDARSPSPPFRSSPPVHAGGPWRVAAVSENNEKSDGIKYIWFFFFLHYIIIITNALQRILSFEFGF